MKVFYDKNQVRYTLISTRGNSNTNWIFLPGGPGCDSSYFNSLTDLLTLPGNIWYIDLPGNGSHNIQKDNFDTWLSIFIPTLQGFQNPILVGHSFGGMLPLLFKECEHLLKGFIILNSAPCLWIEEATCYAKRHQLPDLTASMQEFIEHPTQETFDRALNICMPYYFPPVTLERGRKLLSKTPFPFEPAVWWQHKAVEINYNASWIPQSVETLIIGSEFDAITPYSLYKNDERFNRENIKRAYINGAGHFSWIEKPDEVKSIIHRFATSLQEIKHHTKSLNSVNGTALTLGNKG